MLTERDRQTWVLVSHYLIAHRRFIAFYDINNWMREIWNIIEYFPGHIRENTKVTR